MLSSVGVEVRTPTVVRVERFAASTAFQVVIVDDELADRLVATYGRYSGLARHATLYVLVQETVDPLRSARWTAAGGGPVLCAQLSDDLLGAALRSVVLGRPFPATHVDASDRSDSAPPRDQPRSSHASSPAIHLVRGAGPGESRPWRTVRDALVYEGERRYLDSVLRSTAGRLGQAARRAGMSERTLFEKMRRHRLRKEDYRQHVGGRDA
ncbi:MAG: hypothetical protein B7733_22395 [Myxococcales bacterium FL481]|nr:MAG: hypothetical protein B7733_22395 [Myxococcales bacterium FL481]